MSRPVTLKMVYREVKSIKQILEELAERSSSTCYLRKRSAEKNGESCRQLKLR